LVSANSQLRRSGSDLTFRTYRTVGKFAPSTICDRFGSWNNALRGAGLSPKDEKNTPVEVLFDNLRIVWIAKGKQPVYRDMNAPPSRYTGSTYNARFGGWRKALEAFVAAFAQEQEEFLNANPRENLIKIKTKTARSPSLALRFLVLKRDNFRCVACGRSPATVPGLVLEVDHVDAWCRDGATIADNLQTLCFDCNRGKGAT